MVQGDCEMKPTRTHVLTVSRCLTVAIIASIAATGGMLAAVGVTQADSRRRTS